MVEIRQVPRFVLLQVIDPHYHNETALENMFEEEQLVATYGGEVVEKSVQHRAKPNPNTYIYGGKLEWLKEVVADKQVDVVVLNALVNAGQIFRLEQELWAVNPKIKVWDRVDLILNIFDKHAESAEAKLQIELARISYMGPRMYGLGGTVLSRQGGGIGTRGLGETNIEIERRRLKEHKQDVQHQLNKLVQERQKRIEQRKERGVKSVALVGYTSAGKTSLFNALTQKDKVTHQSLFTTLDTVSGKLMLPGSWKPVLITDTIGFIEDLPPFLIKAFRSTLMESVEADVVLHVIDTADPKMEEKVIVVEAILKDLGVKQTVIPVLNKIDVLDKEQVIKLKKQYEHLTMCLVSAKTEEGLNELKEKLRDELGIKSENYY
jgi:GTP-binding protein HflX